MTTPVLHLLAGPNGAGKTTYFERIIAQTGLEFVNADILASTLWPGDESRHAYDASALAASRRQELLSGQTSFATETVFSHPSKVEMARQAVELGYLLYLHVILIPEELAVSRVSNRVLHGGHSVPEPKVRERYQRLWAHIAESIVIAHDVGIFDNSSATTPFRRVATFRSGSRIGAADWPSWTPTELRVL